MGLKFGTSGMRGTDDSLTNYEVFIAVKGFLNYLFTLPKNQGGCEKGCKVAIAGDFRPSTDRILKASAAAILSESCIVEYNGKIPTPTISLYGFSNNIPSIMITGSHNPYGQNGIKFNTSIGEVLKKDETPMKEEIEKARNEIKEIPQKILKEADSIISSNGKDNAEKTYIERYVNTFGNILENEKIVFYQQTAVGRDILPDILEKLGAQIIKSGKVDEKKQFIPVDTEDMKESIIKDMQKFAEKNNTDYCITTDGDSDRPALVYLQDKKPKFLKGDLLNILTIINIKPDFVACPISTNSEAVKLLQDKKIKVEQTKIGSPHLIKTMLSKKDAKTYSFEVNGGTLLGSEHKIPKELHKGTGKINALATRDALFPLLMAIIIKKVNGKTMSELITTTFKGYESFATAGLVENLEHATTKGLERYSSEIGKSFIDSLNPDNLTEINLIKNNKEKYNKIKETIEKYTKPVISSEIIKINYLDGVRVYFANKDIIHLRPSGNAAQFRIYIETTDENNANKLLNEFIKPESGILVKMINDYINNKLF